MHRRRQGQGIAYSLYPSLNPTGPYGEKDFKSDLVPQIGPVLDLLAQLGKGEPRNGLAFVFLSDRSPRPSDGRRRLQSLPLRQRMAALARIRKGAEKTDCYDERRQRRDGCQPKLARWHKFSQSRLHAASQPGRLVLRGSGVCCRPAMRIVGMAWILPISVALSSSVVLCRSGRWFSGASGRNPFAMLLDFLRLFPVQSHQCIVSLALYTQ